MVSMFGKNKVNYKYNEKELLKEFSLYVDKTYDQHYSKDKFQATEFIMDGGHGEGFCIGNILKYAQRYGKKDGYNRADLLKVIHYGFLALYNHDTHIKEAKSDEN
tara:strand:+ start:449 stop:763 length:315 start_codon:yes stop_codon:yes gene_type:complete